MKIIYLNGPSSSGKTSICRELQSILPEHYLLIGIDLLINMMPERSNSWSTTESKGFSWKEVSLPNGKTGMRITSGPHAKKINDSYHAVVHALLKSGQNLIVDDVGDGINDLQIWIDELKDHSLTTVGVFCSLEELARREVARQDRMIGSAAEQFYRVHNGINYDITVHSDKLSPRECANQIAKRLTGGRF